MKDLQANRDEPKSASLPIAVVSFLSLVWIAAAFIFANNAHHESQCVTAFECLKANEWGDLLAGVFAPVAFLWLALTVWIQSSELKEQRRELQLTRREFEQNRAVMEQQANEAREQARYIGQQTKILAAEEERRQRAEIDKEFDAHVEAVAAILQREPGLGIFHHGGGPIFRPELPSKTSGEAAVRSYSQQLDDLWKALPQEYYEFPPKLTAANPEATAALISIIDQALSLRPDMSRQAQIARSQLMLDRMSFILKEMLYRSTNANITKNPR